MSNISGITLGYANLAVCLMIYALVYSQLTDYDVHGVQRWVRDVSGAHTESCSMKDPLSVLGSLVFIVLLFAVNQVTIKSRFGARDA